MHPGLELVAIRQGEAQEAARRLGIAATEVLQNPDGQLVPSIEARNEVVRQIRSWEADVVITHRVWDYHPDHRYTGQLVQDSAYLVMVPFVCPETPALRRNPAFFHLEDSFQSPVPFRADIAVNIDDVWPRKLDALDAHRSQVYEWLPYLDGDQVPADAAARRAWLDAAWSREPQRVFPCGARAEIRGRGRGTGAPRRSVRAVGVRA